MLSSVMMKQESSYQEIAPSKDLEDLIHSFWTHKNHSDSPEVMSIFPDSFFKIVFVVRGGQVANYFMTGLWTEQKEFSIPPKASTFGCRLRILAPEFLIDEKVASILNNLKQLNQSFLNIESFDFSAFENSSKTMGRRIEKNSTIKDHTRK